MKSMHKYLFSLFVMLCILSACSSEKKDKPEITIGKEEVIVNKLVSKQLQSAQQIFYSLPSPLEIAMMLKRSGAEYNFEILNSVENASRYTTNKSMALNLGIYSTNLSYASIFDQTQITIKYMSAAKKLAENLGVLNAIDEGTIQRIEENLNDREMILDIISETLLNTNAYLEEEKRSSVASIIMVGGWVEGLHIATSLVEPGKLDSELVKRICDQKFTIKTIINLLMQSMPDKDIESLIVQMNELKDYYDRIDVKSLGISSYEIIKNEGTKIRSKNEMNVSQADFDALVAKIKEIRNSFTQ